jgi:hypothetical protein
VAAPVYLIAFIIYLIALLVATAQVYKRYKSVKALATMILLPLQHFIYGIGFWKGLLEARRSK